MCTAQVNRQLSSDLDIYLPSELNSTDKLYYQSFEMLIKSFDFDLNSPAHRLESSLFDPMDDDLNASLSFLTDELLANDDNSNNLYDYFSEQSTVIPHLPNLSNRTPANVDPTLSPSSSDQTDLSPPTSPTNSTQFNIKRFLIYDETTGRERRPLLYEFIRLVLEYDEYSHLAEYIDRKHGIFKLHKPKDISELWRQVKGRNSDNKMTYDKLARAIRYYYSSGIMYPSQGRFTFRFGPKSGFGITWWPAY